jgi:DNA repair protein RadC
LGKLKALFQDYGLTRQTKRVRVQVIRPVFTREVVREKMPAYLATDRFTTPSQVYEMFSELIQETKEHFLALHLDGKNRIICLDRVSIGSLNQSIVHPREVFKSAVLSSASALILVHNHPTGDPSPSSEDIQITRRLREAGTLLGIAVLDHIIIGNGEYCSFVEKGLL